MSQELPPLVAKKFEERLLRYQELEREIGRPDLSVPARIALTKEFGGLRKSIESYQEYLRLLKEIGGNEEMTRARDPELRSLAREELTRLRQLLATRVESLIEDILVDDRQASRNVIMEVRAGEGGDEAALFAADLFRMYSKFAERRGWKIDIIDSSPTDLKGFREIVFSMSGDGVYRDLRYEMGGHRVQRVPETETQ